MLVPMPPSSTQTRLFIIASSSANAGDTPFLCSCSHGVGSGTSGAPIDGIVWCADRQRCVTNCVYTRTPLYTSENPRIRGGYARSLIMGFCRDYPGMRGYV